MKTFSPLTKGWDRRRTVRAEPVRLESRNAWRAMAERRKLMGLTTRGTIPKRRAEERMILSELDALAGSIAAVYEWLPNEGKNRCLALAARLAAIRKQLL